MVDMAWVMGVGEVAGWCHSELVTGNVALRGAATTILLRMSAVFAVGPAVPGQQWLRTRLSHLHWSLPLDMVWGLLLWQGHPGQVLSPRPLEVSDRAGSAANIMVGHLVNTRCLQGLVPRLVRTLLWEPAIAKVSLEGHLIAGLQRLRSRLQATVLLRLRGLLMDQQVSAVPHTETWTVIPTPSLFSHPGLGDYRSTTTPGEAVQTPTNHPLKYMKGNFYNVGNLVLGFGGVYQIVRMGQGNGCCII